MSPLEKLVFQAIADINTANDIYSLETVRTNYLGKKGHLTIQMKKLRELPIDQLPVVGAAINAAKKQLLDLINARKKLLQLNEIKSRIISEKIDISLPGRRIKNGNLHPVTQTINRIETFFMELGFLVSFGPEIEDTYYNFDALNIPSYHPARSEYDTFWLDSKKLLRTQTSNVQIRVMAHQQPPIRIISPGRVYRNDYDQTHTPMFHQIEGLLVDSNVSLSNIKGILHDFLDNFFEEKLKIRFRPSYFPFTEPSAEIDIKDQNGKWLEVIGCGIIHPNVLRNVNINSEIYSGFAFGIGIERLTMLRYGIKDLRAFFENDIRFLEQFK
ncbi:phenylalanine--tRNA ligase subunit alpha [Candidatus Ishikawella capsulata]|uniref:Phenylalanine--tRNA ligase alpha subunit n=1 Tax=Candidatus Ishikawaella capsulata Mpkobe TaxID=476281 RepID=C5WD62_9ENTR|nr:phenylalanine--tRNA ligase subunit alpha [Candidatus Ishikawaella capsulata]BAH83268.1 phenylalanyl-tRNA synthetase alpha subunit [Candidatus Ishikawaella capsulata Mpkobe]